MHTTIVIVVRSPRSIIQVSLIIRYRRGTVGFCTIGGTFRPFRAVPRFIVGRDAVYHGYYWPRCGKNIAGFVPCTWSKGDCFYEHARGTCVEIQLHGQRF